MRPFSRDCDYCGSAEERTFRDSWTGTNLCLPCLAPVIGRIHLSPSEDGDNLRDLLDGEETPSDADTDPTFPPF